MKLIFTLGFVFLYTWCCTAQPSGRKTDVHWIEDYETIEMGSDQNRGEVQVFLSPLDLQAEFEEDFFTSGTSIEAWLPISQSFRVEMEVLHPWLSDVYRYRSSQRKVINFKERLRHTRYLQVGGAYTFYRKEKEVTMESCYHKKMTMVSSDYYVNTLYMVSFPTIQSTTMSFRGRLHYTSPMLVGEFSMSNGGLYKGIEVLSDTSQYVEYPVGDFWATRYHSLKIVYGFHYLRYRNARLKMTNGYMVNTRVFRGFYVDMLLSYRSWFSPVETQLFNDEPSEYFLMTSYDDVIRAREVAFAQQVGVRAGVFWTARKSLRKVNWRYLFELNFGNQPTLQNVGSVRLSMAMTWPYPAWKSD